MDLDYVKLNVYIEELLKDFKSSKFSRIFKTLSKEEKRYILSNEKILEEIRKVRGYEFLNMIFRNASADVQEMIWNIPECQKSLLGFGKFSKEVILDSIRKKKFFNHNDLPKKNQKQEFYYSAVKLRELEVFLRYIKSPKILESLPDNYYFQMIILCSKKVPNSILNYVNVNRLFFSTINSDFYRVVDGKSKANWCSLINNYTPNILLPNDYRSFFFLTEGYRDYYETPNGKYKMASMLRNKKYALSSKGIQIVLDDEVFRKLTLPELNELTGCTEEGFYYVDQEKLREGIQKIVDEKLKNGEIFSKDYLDMRFIKRDIQYLVFKTILDKCGNDKENENGLLEYLFNLMFQEEYNEFEKKALMLSIKNVMLQLDKETMAKFFEFNVDDLKSMFLLRFNKTSPSMKYLKGISPKQIARINVKHINKIVPYIQRLESDQDEISDLYGKAIKMYLTFGLEKTLELLSGKYEVGKDFLDNVSKLDVTGIELKIEGKKYIPVINEEFNRFIFTANNIKLLFDSESSLYTAWFYLFNNFEEIKDICKGHITARQAEIILREQANKVNYKLEPDCYKLDSVLYEAGLGNKTHMPNDTIYDEMVKIYRKQIVRKSSTIPYVSGTLENGWSYEVMPLDSVVAYVLGYRAGCCIRVKDLAHNHLLHALLCENGRILLTKKPDGSIASFSPLKRNGEVLIANSIETIDKRDESFKFIEEAFRAGIKDIVDTSNCTEIDKALKVATLGLGYNRRPYVREWPSDIKTPTILEKNDPVYGNTDCYHTKLGIVYEIEGTSLYSLKYGKVDYEYYDPRNKIKSCLFGYKGDAIEQYRILRIVDSIRYKKCSDSLKSSFQKTSPYFVNCVFCNDDWYILIDYLGNIHTECLDDDPGARKEMEATLSVIKDYQKRKEDIRSLVLRYNIVRKRLKT